MGAPPVVLNPSPEGTHRPEALRRSARAKHAHRTMQKRGPKSGATVRNQIGKLDQAALVHRQHRPCAGPVARPVSGARAGPS